MKRYLLILGAVFAVCGASLADVTVSYLSTGYGVAGQNAMWDTSGAPVGATVGIYLSDVGGGNNFNPADPLNPGGNDYFVGTYNTGTVGEFDLGAAPTYDLFTVNGGAYVFVPGVFAQADTYVVLFGTSGVPGPGEIYGIGSDFGLADTGSVTGVPLQYFGTAGLPIVAPVPEPGTWALMVAGLGMVGLWTRKRRG